jgi:hypothetical protein
MKILWSAVMLVSSMLPLSVSVSGQDIQTAIASEQASWDDCAQIKMENGQLEAKWDSIYPASNAAYVGGTIPEMQMSSGLHVLGFPLHWLALEPRQFRRNGQIALSPGCLLFAFKAKNNDSFNVNANYHVHLCTNEVKLSDKDRTCIMADDIKHAKYCVLTVPYAKVNLLSRAKYATSDLTGVSTAYITFSASILTAIYQTMHNVSAKEKVLGVTAAGLTLYYYFAIARPRTGDNYIAVFVERFPSQITLSRKSNRATVTTSLQHYFREGQQIQISDVANSDLAVITDISRDANGIVTVNTNKAHGLMVGAQVQIAEVPDPSFNGQFQVASTVRPTQFTYEQKDKLKAASSVSGKAQDVWNGTFLIDSVTPKTLTYWQIGPDERTTSTGTVAGAPVNTSVTINSNFAPNQPVAAIPSVSLSGTATLNQPTPKSDELFKKGDLLMFRIPNHHDYYNIAMTLSGGTGLTFVSETAEKSGK